MRIWRKMEKISWTEHISNEVLKLVEEERSLLTIIRMRQRNWMRHIMRGDSLQREIIKGRMEGKRGRGRPRQKLLDWMMSRAHSFPRQNFTSPAENLVNSAAHRGKTDEIPRLTADTQLNFCGLIKS